MTPPGHPRFVRAAGGGGLVIGAFGLLSTVWVLAGLLAFGGLGKAAHLGGTPFALVLLCANVTDGLAYLALIVIAVRLLRLQVSGRRPAQVLSAYFAFMAVAEPFGVYVFAVAPALRRAGRSVPGGAEFLAANWGAGILLAYSIALFWTMHRWGRKARVAPKPSVAARTAAGLPTAASEGRRAATNAPRHWPAVRLDVWLPEQPFYGQLAVLAALTEGFGPRLRSDVQVALLRSRLYDDGVLSIPLVVQESGRETAVLVYSDAGAQSAAHYSGARQVLREREGLAAVYYAPAPLSPTRGAPVLERLDTRHFSKPEEEREAAEYALWWPTPAEPLLRDSAALGHIDTWFESLDGYAYAVLSPFVKDLELVQVTDEAAVYGLPVQPLMLPLDGPGDLSLYLHASQREGLWFAFDVLKTPVVLRNRLLAGLAELGRNLRQAVKASGGKLAASAEEQTHALAHWRRARAQALEREAGGASDTRVGSIVEAGPGRVGLAGASSGGERQDAASRLITSEALTEFAREQMARGFSLLAAHARQKSAEGEPNLHPFVAIRKGSDIHHVTLSHFEEPEATAMGPVLAAEHEGLAMIAVVCDGIVRLGGERFDALRICAQEAGESKARVFTQRYRLEKGKAEMLGNWFVEEGHATLLATGVATPPEEPSASLTAFLDEIVDVTLAFITSGDPSGAELYDEHEPLFSPALHVRANGETRMHRFMMGNLAWAQGAALQTLEKSPKASLAVFVYDHVAERNGQPARSLRFHAHERGASGSWLYGLSYDVPMAGRRFEAAAQTVLLRRGRPLLPA